MNFKIIFFTSILVIAVNSVVAQKGTKVSLNELKNLIGCWQGTLNYSGTIIRKPYTTAAELIIKQIGNLNQLEFLHFYTKEPNDNSLDTITLSKDCRKLNNETIKSKRYNSEGYLEIITEALGFDNDNNKPGIFKCTYTLGQNIYTYKKEVKLEEQTEWLERQLFTYVRKVCSGRKTVQE